MSQNKYNPSDFEIIDPGFKPSDFETLDSKVMSKPIEKKDVKKTSLPFPLSVFTNKPEDRSWLNYFSGKEDIKKAADYIYGKDKKQRNIQQPPFVIQENEGDNVESSKYKVASLRTTGKVNPTSEELDDPYIMESIIKNKKAVDVELEEVSKEYSKTKDPMVLANYRDTRIKPYYQTEEFNLKNTLQKNILEKEDQLNKSKNDLTLGEELTYRASKTLERFSLGFTYPFNDERDEYRNKELDSINNEIESLKKLEDYALNKTNDKIVKNTKYGTLTLADIGKKLENLYKRKNEIVPLLEQSKLSSEKDLQDLMVMDSNILGEIKSLHDYRSDFAEKTRKTPKEIVNQQEEDFLYDLSKYGTISNSLESSEMLDANMLTFNSVWDNQSLRDLVQNKVELKNVQGVTAHVIGDLTKFQENTYKGLLKLKENVLANKDEEYGYPSIIKELNNIKKQKIEEYKEKGILLTENDLKQINDEILNYTTLLNDQDLILNKLNNVEKKYFSQYKDLKEEQERQSEIAQTYLKEDFKLNNLKNISTAISLEGTVFAKTLYGATAGTLSALGVFVDDVLKTPFGYSKSERIKDKLDIYNAESSNTFFYVPEEIKRRTPVKITTDEDGKLDFDWSLSGSISEGVILFVESMALAKYGQVLGGVMGKVLSKTPVLKSLSPFVSEGFLTGIGGVTSSNFVLSEIDKQNFELFLKGEIEFDDVASKSFLEKSLEGGTEMLWTPELKLLNPVGKDIVKKYALKKFLRQSLGETFLTEDMKYLAKSIVKNFVQTPGGEIIEEVAGNLGQDIFIDPLYKENLQYNPELNTTVLNNIETAITTYISMLPNSIIGLGGDVSNRRNISKMMDYEIASNADEFLKHAIAGINSLNKEDFNNIYPNFSNKEEAIKNTDKTYKEYKNAYEQALPTSSVLVNEGQKRDYFNTVLDITKFYNKENLSDNDKERLLSLTNKKISYDIYAENLKNKPIREQLSQTLEENLKNIDFEEINVPKLQLISEQLNKWKNIFGNEEQYKNKVEILNDKIKEVNERISNLTPVNLEKKAQENNQNGVIEITRPTLGNLNLKLNTPYYLSTIDDVSIEGAKIKKRPLITILQDNGDGTIKISSEGEVVDIPFEDLNKYKFTPEDVILKWRENKSPEAFVFDHENDVFSYEFGKATNTRDKTVLGRIEYNSLNKTVDFVFKDKKGNIQKYTLSKSDLKSVNKGKLKYKRTLETEAEFNAKQAKMSESASKTDFEQLQNQALQRLQFIQDFINKKAEELKSTKFVISKIEDKLLDTEIEIENLQKQLNQKTDLKTKKGKTRIDVQRLFNKLNELSNSQKELQNTLNDLEQQKQDIENQIEYTKQYEDVEFESKKSLVDQLIEDQFNLELQLEQINDVVFNLKKLIDNIENAIKKIANIVSNLVKGFQDKYGKEKTTGFDPEIIKELTEIDKLLSNEYPDYESFISKNPEYLKNLNKFNELVNNNLDKIDLSEKEIENLKQSIKANVDIAKNIQSKIRYQEELISEAQKAQEEFKENKNVKKIQSIAEQIFESQKPFETTNEVLDNEEDSKLVSEESNKIELSDFFSTTTSGATFNGDLNLNNPQVLRLQNFLNNVENLQAYSLLAITKDNAKEYGLEDILFSDEKTTNKTDDQNDNDIKLVIVIKDNTGVIHFVNSNGEILEKGTQNKDNIVTTSLRKASAKWSDGQKAYVNKLKQTEEEENKLVSELETTHAKLRQDIINAVKSGANAVFGIKYISRGRNTQQGQPNSAIETVIPISVNLASVQVIQIPQAKEGKTAPINYMGNKAIPMPVGRPILSHNQTFEFLNSRKFISKDVEKFMSVFKALYDAYKTGDKKNQEILLKYLQKTLYLRRPEKVSKLTNKSQETSIGRSQIWFSNENNTIFINFSKDFKIPFNFESGNTQALLTVKAFFQGKDNKGIFHNVDNQGLIGEPFIEVISINKDGKIETREWKSYQEYLLSNKYPNGSERPIEEIPLTVNVNPSTPNTPNKAGRYIVFDNKSNQSVVTAVKTQTVEQTAKENIPQPTIQIDENTKFEEKLSAQQDPSKLTPNKFYRWKLIKDGVEKFIDFTINDKNFVKIFASNWEHPIKDLAKSLYEYTSGKKQKPGTVVLFDLIPIFQKQSFIPVESTEDLAAWAGVAKTSTSPIEPISESTTENSTSAEDLMKGFTSEDKGNFDYRTATKSNYKLENLKKAKIWFEERFPQIEFRLAFGLIDGKAWGRLKDKVVTLSDVAEEGTIYHEAFEVVHKYILKPIQLKALYREFKNRKGSFIDYETGKSVEYSKATNYQIKEQLAEEYREYELSGRIKKWEGEYNKNSLFRKIANFIDFILNGLKNPESIQEVFDKISEGAYKDFVIPVQTENLNSEYKTADIKLTNPVFFNDLMKSMTNIMFGVLTEQNRSIPEILTNNYDLGAEQLLIKAKIDAFYGGNGAKNVINKTSKQGFISSFQSPEKFKDLMSTISKATPSLYSNLFSYVKDNRLNTQQTLEKLYDLYNSYVYIDSNWENLKKDHTEYLAKYGLELIENDSEQDEEINTNESKNQNEYERDTLKLNRKLNANTEMKLLIATMREMEWVKSDQPFFVVNQNRERKPKLNSLLMSNLVDYNKTIISLLYKLSPATTFDEMVEILKQEGLHNPSLDQLLNKLKINTPTSQLTEFDVDLRNKFFTSMNNMLVKYKKLILDPQTKTGNSLDLNEENAFNIIKTKWFNTTRANNKLFKTSKEGKITLNKSVLPIDTIRNLDDVILFLNSLGYEYNIDLNRLNSDEKDILLKSSLNLFKVITTNDPELIMYNSPLVRENLNDLADLYIKYTDNYAEPQHLNIDREPVQNIILHNFIGTIAKSFNISKTFDDFISKIPQLNPNSENNAWLSFSQVLSPNSDFFRDGKRSKNLSIEILEGSEVRDSGKGVATSKLSLVDRIAQEFAFNLQGIYYILTPADTKTEWGINFGHFVTQSQSKDNTFILNLFKNYLKSEILTVQQGNPEKLQNIEKAKDSLRFFKDILKDIDLNLTISPEEAIKQKEEEINQAILNWVNNNTNQTYQEFVNNNIIIPFVKSEDNELSFTPIEEMSENKEEKLSILFAPSNFIKEGLTEEEIKELIKFNNLNYTFNIFEQHKLFWGDPAQWKDITKRTKSFTSGRNLSVNNASYFNDFYNKTDNVLSYIGKNGEIQNVNLEPGDLGYVHYDDTIKTVTYQDVIVENDNLEGYDDINEADAEGWSFPLGTREIRRRSNTWTKADQEQFEWDNALCRKDNNIYPEGERGRKLREYDNYILSKGNPYLNNSKIGEKTATLNVQKPIYSGYKDGNTATVNLDKLSLAPLTWRLVKGTQAEQFYLEHFKKGTTYAKVESANKVGITSPTPLYNKDGKLNTQFSHEKLNFKYFGIQVETSTQKNKTPLATQLTKIITMNVDKIKNKILVDNNSKFLSALKKMSKDSIFKEFGIKESIVNGKKVFEFENFETIEQIIQRELKNRNATENLKQAMKVNPDTGKFYLQWDMVIGSERLEAILTSIIDNNILRPKMFGGQMPQIASTLFERKPRIVKKTIKGKPVLTSNELKFYEDEDGKRYCEVYLPFYMKEFIQNGVELSISDLPEDLKYGVGFRIPTQNTNSIENFKIKGFLPVEYGNSIVVPSEITKKAGSDFDIDKLNIYLYNYFINKKTNKPEKIKFLDDSNSTLQERYDLLHKKQAKKLAYLDNIIAKDYEKNVLFNEVDDTSNKLWDAIFGKLNQDLSEYTDDEVSEILQDAGYSLKDYKKLEAKVEEEKANRPTLEEFEKLPIEMQNSRKAVENAYIDNIRAILELPEMFEYLIKPNSAEELKQQAKEINSLYGENKETKSSDYYLSRLNNAKDRHAFLVGKDAVGIGASQQTQNAIGQIVDLAFEEFKEKFHLDFPTNSEDLGDGKTKYSLSNKVDKIGKTISDTISMFIDAFVDIAKDPYIFDINGNLDTASIYITGVRLGIPLPLLTRWFNQPIIREYIKLYQQNKSISTDLKGEKLKKKEIISLLESKFQLGEIKEKNANFTESELENYIKNYVTSQKENTETSQEFKDAQAILLNQFIQLQDLSWDLFRFGQAINLDTTRTISFESIRLKMAKIATALQGRFAPYVKDVYKDTFIGTIYQAKLDLLESIKPLYLTESDKARSVLNPILNNIYNSIGKQDVLEEEAKKLRKHFVTYLLHTIPIKIGNNQQPVLLTSYINDLLLSDKNIATRLRNLQNAQEEEKLPKNFLTKNLLGIIPAFIGKKQKTHNIRPLRKMSDKIDNDLATSDFRNLVNHPQTENFLFDLIRTSLLQSGLNQDPFSISQLIPNDIFQDIAIQIQNYFENTNITDILDGFIDSYYKNQWYNSDLIPKASLKKTSIDENGNVKSRFFNPELLFINKQKENKKINIPFLEYFIESDSSNKKPIFQKEARNPYLLVKRLKTDFDGLPLYSKYEREQMAKKGDFSFQEQILYKRLEIIADRKKDIPLIKKYHKRYNSHTYWVLFYPVNSWGERFNLFEHYKNSSMFSKINPQINNYTDDDISKLLENNGYLTKRYIFQHIFPELQKDNEDFITVLDATLNEQDVFESPEISLSLPQMEKQAITEESPKKYGSFGKDKELFDAYIQGGLKAVRKIVDKRKAKRIEYNEKLKGLSSLLDRMNELENKKQLTNSESNELIEVYKQLRDDWGMETKSPTINKEVEQPIQLKKQNIFTVKPIQSADKKAIIKASVANKYIGFGEGIPNSSTELYRKQAREFANVGNYNSNDVIFVSIGGKRGNPEIRKQQQDKTIKEALKAIELGATLITDNKSYVESSDYNEGEKRLAKNLEAKGYNYSEQTIDGQVLGIWTSQPTKIEQPTVKVEVVSRYSDAEVKANPDKIYVFGDNTQRVGTGGQAQIRNNPNAFGIATKLKPTNNSDAFMSDKDLESNKQVIDSDIAKIKAQNKPLVFPKDGFGTGLAKLKEKAPQTYEYLKQRLLEEFGFNNDTGELSQTQSKKVENKTEEDFQEPCKGGASI